MNTKLSVVTLALLMAGYAQAQPPLINGAIMITGGEVNRCTFGNIDDVWVVTVTALNAKGVLRARRYISGSGNSDCMILPLLGWPGSTVTITGVLQDTLAIPGFASKTPAQISEDCFNVEAFTVGLAPVASGFNPQDPANVVNAQGYGLAWADSDSSLQPGPASYTVAGCGAGDCPTEPAIFNTDDNFATSCTLLPPMR